MKKNYEKAVINKYETREIKPAKKVRDEGKHRKTVVRNRDAKKR